MTPQKSRIILVLSAFFILPFMLVVFKLTTLLYGIRQGYFAGFIVYWAYCALFSIILLEKSQFIKILSLKSLSAKGVYIALAFLPVAGVFFIKYLPNFPLLDTRLTTLVLVNSVINGFLEELYWHGLFLVNFKKNIWVGFWLSSFLFAAWHIALYSISEIYFGGFYALVGGAFLLGMLWSYSSRKLGSILFPLIAHILLNYFAFTGLYLENGF